MSAPRKTTPAAVPEAASAPTDASAAQHARERRYMRAIEGWIVSGLRAGARGRRRRRASRDEPARG
jgi:hypothetical protein